LDCLMFFKIDPFLSLKVMLSENLLLWVIFCPEKLKMPVQITFH
jgi:hypothetical protein